MVLGLQQISLSRQVWLPFADSTGQDQISCCSHLIGHRLDLVQLPARIRSHPAQVAQEDRQLAQASLKAHLEKKSKNGDIEKDTEKVLH